MKKARASVVEGIVSANMAFVLAAGLFLAACEEIPQDAPKPFAGSEETRSYTGAPFDGDKALYERTLAERARTQNEYLATGDAAGR